METKRFSPAFLVILSGIVLVSANGVWLAVNGRPIVVHSYPATSVSDIMGSSGFWGRISFGFTGAAAIPSLLFLTCLIIVMVYYAFRIFRAPRAHSKYGPLVAALSLFSLPFGGGFYIGAILMFIAGVSGLEWPKPFVQTFFGNLASAGRGDSGFFSTIAQSTGSLSRAAFSVAFVGFIVGLGTGLYAYNSNLVKSGGNQAALILLDGQVFWSETVFITSISLVMITLLKWLVFSACIFWIGSKLRGVNTSYNSVAQTLAFCYVPVILEAFMPILFANEPYLSFNWPVAIYIISRLWFLMLVSTAVSHIFDLSRITALGTTLLSGMIYWVGIHALIFPVLNVPGVQIVLPMPESSSLVLFVGGLIAVSSLFLKVFAEKQ